MRVDARLWRRGGACTRPWVQVLSLCSLKKNPTNKTKTKKQSSLGTALNTARSQLRSRGQVGRRWTAVASSAPSWLFMTKQYCSVLQGCDSLHLFINRPA